MRKGLQLTTSTLVALAIAILVLLVLVSMLMGIVPGAGEALGCEADFRVQCNRYISAGGCGEHSNLEIFKGCQNHDPGDCLIGDPSEDAGCKYVRCSVADCAVGSVDKTRVRLACCGGEEPQP